MVIIYNTRIPRGGCSGLSPGIRLCVISVSVGARVQTYFLTCFFLLFRDALVIVNRSADDSTRS